MFESSPLPKSVKVGIQLRLYCLLIAGVRRQVVKVYVARRWHRDSAPHLDNVKGCVFVGVEWLRDQFPTEFGEMVLSEAEEMEISEDKVFDHKGQYRLSL